MSNAKITPQDQPSRDLIVKALDKTLLVEAAAGTGKTTSMVARMVALLAAGKCRIHTLAAVTFTRKAAAELRSRFQVALEIASRESRGQGKSNLEAALNHVERCFIGTIHSFCARLLRERPVEAGVDISFEEMDEAADERVRKQAWNEYVAKQFASRSVLLDRLRDLGMPIGDLWPGFFRFATFPDVTEWPAAMVPPPDSDAVRAFLNEIAGHVARIEPTFPRGFRSTDGLMQRYSRLGRMIRNRPLATPADLMGALTRITGLGNDEVEPEKWPGGETEAKEAKSVWIDYKDKAQEFLGQWRSHRYPVCLEVFKAATQEYDRLRQEAGLLNYQDLLLKAADLLRDKPRIREYFRSRFTHLLVDEFQDTDPIQAEVMLLLTADSPHRTDWHACCPVPGSLFVVGDPKQSIYRFRRADIVTYNRVKDIVLSTGGEVVTLQVNFRSSPSLIDWINHTFAKDFPRPATEYAPVYVPLIPGRQDSTSPGLPSVRKLAVPEAATSTEISEIDADAIAREIREALDFAAEARKNDSEYSEPAGRGILAGDFMIITRRRRNLGLYGRKLQEYGIPHQVVGGSALNRSRELALLHTCLACVTEPDNPVSLVAALRGELFGISDPALYEFRRRGGTFSFLSAIPGDLAPEIQAEFVDAFARLRGYERWLRTAPPVAAMEAIAADLGLIASASLGADGNLRTGSLLKALELLRSTQSGMWTASDLVGYLGTLVREEEMHDGVPAFPPGTSAVQVMNLHKAKGLEARFVFLADPTGDRGHGQELHIERSKTAVTGAMKIQGLKVGWQAPVLAHPAGWDRYAEKEKAFQKAEDTRLFYVAATRAGAQLTLSQRQRLRYGGNRSNPWRFFQDRLSKAATIQCNTLHAVPSSHGPIDGDPDIVQAEAHIQRQWEPVLRPTYATARAKTISLAGKTAPLSGTEHGTEWGTVIHSLLQAALSKPRADLRILSVAALDEQELDRDLADEAIAVVESVMASEIWVRSQTSRKRLVEVPFQMLVPSDHETAVTTVLRGVIDLVFLEADGWVVVDYKTDRRSASALDDLVARYRDQVLTYARAWETITGQKVAESGLYFTHAARYIRL